MSEQQIASLVANRAKMHNMVCRVAEYIATTLEIVDLEIGTKAPFVEVSRQEILHFPTKERQSEMEDLAKTYEFVVQAEDHAERIRDCALVSKGKNVDLTPFVLEKPYYCDDAIIREEGGMVTSTIEVGGIGNRLQLDVADMALEWLHALDKVLSDAAGIARTHECDKALACVKRELAIGIAERVAMMSRESVLNDRLSTRALDALICAEFERSVPHAETTARNDVSALRALRALANDPDSKEARAVLAEEMTLVSYVVRNPPCELRPFMAQLKLDQLARALSPDLDFEVRVALVTFWSDNHGIKSDSNSAHAGFK